MKEKVLQFMRATMVSFEQNVDGIVDQAKTAFGGGIGEDLAAEPAEAVKIIEQKLRERVPLIEDEVVAIYAKHLDENDLDALIAWHESPIAKKLAACAPALQKEIGQAVGNWFAENLKIIEPDLQRVLGTPCEIPETEVVETPPAA